MPACLRGVGAGEAGARRDAELLRRHPALGRGHRRRRPRVQKVDAAERVRVPGGSRAPGAHHRVRVRGRERLEETRARRHRQEPSEVRAGTTYVFATREARRFTSFESTTVYFFGTRRFGDGGDAFVARRLRSEHDHAPFERNVHDYLYTYRTKRSHKTIYDSCAFVVSLALAFRFARRVFRPRLTATPPTWVPFGTGFSG